MGSKVSIVFKLNTMVFHTVSRYNIYKHYGVLGSNPLNTMESGTP